MIAAGTRSVPAGTLLVPAAIINSDHQLMETDANWCANFSAALPSKPPSTLQIGTDVAITNSKEKERLFREYKAHAVDMESHILGEYAKERGVPFIVIRSVATLRITMKGTPRSFAYSPRI